MVYLIIFLKDYSNWAIQVSISSRSDPSRSWSAERRLAWIPRNSARSIGNCSRRGSIVLKLMLSRAIMSWQSSAMYWLGVVEATYLRLVRSRRVSMVFPMECGVRCWRGWANLVKQSFSYCVWWCHMWSSFSGRFLRIWIGAKWCDHWSWKVT